MQNTIATGLYDGMTFGLAFGLLSGLDSIMFHHAFGLRSERGSRPGRIPPMATHPLPEGLFPASPSGMACLEHH
jgi:hypothetical protein